jgi:hypothetical protein
MYQSLTGIVESSGGQHQPHIRIIRPGSCQEKERKLTLNFSMSQSLTVQSKLVEANTSGIFRLFVPGPDKIKKEKK